MTEPLRLKQGKVTFECVDASAEVEMNVVHEGVFDYSTSAYLTKEEGIEIVQHLINQFGIKLEEVRYE